MTPALHPLAPHHLPPFITPPGETDVLFVVMVISIITAVLIIGNIYFKLHSLPEHMAHRSNHAQMQLVGVMALVALFTHNHLFWFAALLIAALDIPDFSTPLDSISRSLEKLSGRLPPDGTEDSEANTPPSATLNEPQQEA